MVRSELIDIDAEATRDFQRGTARESAMLLLSLSLFLSGVVGLALFARYEFSSSAFLPTLDLDPTRFLDRLDDAAEATQSQIGWLFGIAVTLIVGSFVATLTRHQWSGGDQAQAVGGVAIAGAALIVPFAFLLLAGATREDSLLPVALMSALALLIVVPVAVSVGRLAVRSADERLGDLTIAIQRTKARRLRLASWSTNWWVGAIASLLVSGVVAVASSLLTLAFAGVPLDGAWLVAVVLPVGALALGVAPLTFGAVLLFAVSTERVPQFLVAGGGLLSSVAMLLAIWLDFESGTLLVRIIVSIAIGIPILSALIPGGCRLRWLFIADSARAAAKTVLDRRLRRLVDECNRIERERSPFVV